jgi:hypothetical protein
MQHIELYAQIRDVGATHPVVPVRRPVDKDRERRRPRPAGGEHKPEPPAADEPARPGAVDEYA